MWPQVFFITPTVQFFWLFWVVFSSSFCCLLSQCASNVSIGLPRVFFLPIWLSVISFSSESWCCMVYITCLSHFFCLCLYWTSAKSQNSHFLEAVKLMMMRISGWSTVLATVQYATQTAEQICHFPLTVKQHILIDCTCFWCSASEISRSWYTRRTFWTCWISKHRCFN